MIRAVIAAGAFTALAATAAGQEPQDGGLPAHFLGLGASPRPVAMGRAYAGLSDDAAGALANPAGLARAARRGALVSHGLLYQGAFYDSVALAWPTLAHGSLAVSYLRLSVPAAELRSADGAAGGSFSGADQAVSVAYARRLGPLCAGAGVRFLRQDVGGDDTSAVATDVGLQLQPPVPGLLLGLYAQNAIGSRLGAVAIPLEVRLGAAYRGPVRGMLLSLDLSQNQRRDLRIGAGAEYWVLPFAALRAGYLHPGHPAAGLAGTYGPFALDYAVESTAPALLHRVSLSYFFGPDLALPQILLRAPVVGPDRRVVVGSSPVQLDFSAYARESLAEVRIARHALAAAGRSELHFKRSVGIREGANDMTVHATDIAGRSAKLPLVVVYDRQPPVVDVSAPAPRTRTRDGKVRLVATASDESEVLVVTVDGEPVVLQPGRAVRVDTVVPLRKGGRNTILVAATDRFGQTRTREIEVVREGGPAEAEPATTETESRAYFERGRLYYRSGELRSAIVEWKLALLVRPDFTEARKLLVKAEAELAAAEGGRGAAEALQRTLERRFALGKQYFDTGQWKKALVEFQVVLDMYALHQQAQEYAARTRARIDEQVTAKLREAQEWRARGSLPREMAALREASQLDEANPAAKAAYEDAKRRAPQEKRALYLKGLDLYSAGRTVQAIAVWKEALLLSPDDADVKRAVEKAERKLVEIEGMKLGR